MSNLGLNKFLEEVLPPNAYREEGQFVVAFEAIW